MPKPNLLTNDMETIRTQFESWMEGAHAGALGMKTHDNPYPPRTAAGDSWENGCESISFALKGNQDGEPVAERQISYSMVAKWLAFTAPEVHEMFIREFSK